MNPVIALMKSEMKLSLGCTEPAAIGLAVSRTCQLLGEKASHIDLKVSSNIFKNAFCVKIPNTPKAGIDLAAAFGFLLSKPGDSLEIFSGVREEMLPEAEALLKNGFVSLLVVPSSQFYIEVQATAGTAEAVTVTSDRHDNVVFESKNGKVLLDKREAAEQDGEKEETAFDILNCPVKELLQICEETPLAELDFLRETKEINWEIVQKGFADGNGLQIGRTMKKLIADGVLSDDLISNVKANTAAACDFRMGGGNGAVMTVAGSGNQGIECTIPVITAAKHLNVTEEKMLRALMLSILVTIHIKYHVGRLSPVCGATVAGTGSACAICYLMGGSIEQIEGALKNMMGNVFGMVCDGAKDGCALKLANCAGEAVMAAAYALNGSIIKETDGIISREAEDTVKNAARLAKDGMAAVDMKIIDIMREK